MPLSTASSSASGPTAPRFRRGDLVVVARAGVGRVESIETLRPAGQPPCPTYRIVVRALRAKVWVPLARAQAERLRPPVSASRVPAILQVVEATEAPRKRANWNQRRKRYDTLLASNDPIQLAALVGELARVRARKPLSFSERRLFETSSSMLRTELGAVSTRRDATLARLEAALAR